MKCNLISLKLHNGVGGFTILRVSTSPFDIVFNGDVYSATHDVISIEDSETTKEINKTGVLITLSGIDPVIQAFLDGGGFKRAPIDIITVNVPEGTNVVDTYKYFHRGYCDTPKTTIDFKSGTISLTIETNNIFTDIDKKPNLLRCSMASHSSRHPGDKFFQYTANIDQVELWRD